MNPLNTTYAVVLRSCNRICEAIDQSIGEVEAKLAAVPENSPERKPLLSCIEDMKSLKDQVYNTVVLKNFMKNMSCIVEREQTQLKTPADVGDAINEIVKSIGDNIGKLGEGEQKELLSIFDNLDDESSLKELLLPDQIRFLFSKLKL